MKLKPEIRPRYSLDEYRKFIREATPFMSLVAGRKLKASDADTMTDQEVEKLALAVDQRVDDLNKRPLPGGDKG